MMLVKSPSYHNLYSSRVLASFVTPIPLISSRALSKLVASHPTPLVSNSTTTTDPTLAPHLLQSHPRHFLLCIPKRGTASYLTMSKKSGDIAEQLRPANMFPSLSATSVLVRHVVSHLPPQRPRHRHRRCIASQELTST